MVQIPCFFLYSKLKTDGKWSFSYIQIISSCIIRIIMYIAKHFKIDDEGTIYNFIEKYSFATLFSQHNG